MPNPTRPKFRYARLTRNIVLILVLTIAGIVVAYNVWGPKRLLPGLPANVNRILLNGTITVNIGYYYIEFSVPSGVYDVQVLGSFIVSGGSSIRVFITNNTAFSEVKAISYDSGRSLAGNITARLTPGTYYLVYDNDLQSSEKIVETAVTLSYNEI